MTNRTIIQSVTDFIFGHKYYVNIINVRGTVKCETTSFIHYDKSAAEKHREDIEATASFKWIETVSFRSRRDYRIRKITNNAQPGQ